jgi:hypothetical protein
MAASLKISIFKYAHISVVICSTKIYICNVQWDNLAKPLPEQERGGQGNGPALPSSTACHFQVTLFCSFIPPYILKI